MVGVLLNGICHITSHCPSLVDILTNKIRESAIYSVIDMGDGHFSLYNIYMKTVFKLYYLISSWKTISKDKIA